MNHRIKIIRHYRNIVTELYHSIIHGHITEILFRSTETKNNINFRFTIYTSFQQSCHLKSG